MSEIYSTRRLTFPPDRETDALVSVSGQPFSLIILGVGRKKVENRGFSKKVFNFFIFVNCDFI